MEIIKGEDLKGMQFVKDEDGRLVVYEPKGRYIPKKGEKYWFIGIFGNVCWAMSYNDFGDKWIRKRQPVFRTEEECNDYKWFLEQLDKYSYELSIEEWNDNNIVKWNLYYEHKDKKIDYDWNCIVQCNNCYFTKESIQQFRETVGDERIKKYIFNIWE